MSFDPEMFGQAMGEAILKAIEPLKAEIADLKAQLAALPAPINGKDGAPGKDGSSVTLADVEPLIKSAAEQIRVEADAAIKEPLQLAEQARDMLLKAVSDLRQPEDGKSVTIEDVRPVLDDAIKTVREEAQKTVDAAVQAIPVPKDGRDGVDGKDGAPGEKGADGVGAAGAMIDRDGSLMLTMTNGEVKNLGPVVGKDGQNGVDGKDGVSFDSFELEYLPESHEVAVKASAAGRTKELRFPAGGIRPAGYWREGIKAKANEAWVHDGSTWYSVRDTETRPESKSADWIIGARRGRDGETVVKTVREGPPQPIKLGA